jgi:hypothetical protein
MDSKVTVEQTIELSKIIESIKVQIHLIDFSVLENSIKAFEKQINFQEVAFILHPSYDSNKTNILKIQLQSLKHLASFIECLKEADKLKNKSGNDIDAIRGMFV